MGKSKYDAAEAELTRLYNIGLKCEMHGMPVTRMGKMDLIAFIGFLDELSTKRETDLRKCKK